MQEEEQEAEKAAPAPGSSQHENPGGGRLLPCAHVQGGCGCRGLASTLRPQLQLCGDSTPQAKAGGPHGVFTVTALLPTKEGRYPHSRGLSGPGSV